MFPICNAETQTQTERREKFGDRPPKNANDNNASDIPISIAKPSQRWRLDAEFFINLLSDRAQCTAA